jgi:hypothetical protein
MDPSPSRSPAVGDEAMSFEVKAGFRRHHLI